MTSMRAAVWISIYQSDSLNIIADMMIVFISSHNEILLCLFDPEVSNGLGALSTNIDVCEILFGLAVLTLLVSQTW